MLLFFDLMERSKGAARTLVLLAIHMSRKNRVKATQSDLSKILNCSRRRMTDHIKLLKSEGWITTEREGYDTVYTVNADVFWQAGANEKESAGFYMRMDGHWSSRYPQVLRDDTPKIKDVDTVDSTPAIRYRDPHPDVSHCDA